MAGGKLEVDGESVEWQYPGPSGGFAIRHPSLNEGQWTEDADGTAVDANDTVAVRTYAENIFRALKRRHS
jgi:hypothetical protein